MQEKLEKHATQEGLCLVSCSTRLQSLQSNKKLFRNFLQIQYVHMLAARLFIFKVLKVTKSDYLF